MVLDAEAGAHLDRLSERRLSEQLETLVGAASPFGSIGRRFNNEHHFAALDDIEEMSLSLRLLPDTYLAREMRSGNNMLNTSSRREERERAIRARERAQILAEATEAARLAYAGRTLKAESVDIETMADLPEGSALIVIGVEGLTARLVRMNTQEGDGPDLIEPLRSGAMQAFVAPAGDWRLVSLWTEGVATSYCLGAPVLRVNAGDVVYAGSFDGHGVVDFALDDVRASLAARPELAERLQAGSYTNGSTFGCAGATYVTAYEIPNAPFADDYPFGSRAAGASAGAEP
jgi:hypothetical protein